MSEQDQNFSEWKNKVIDAVFGFQTGVTSHRTLSVTEVNPDSLDQAIYCAVRAGEYGTLGNKKIGAANPKLNPEVCGYQPGQVVLFEEQDSDRLTVYTPWSKEAIDKQKAEGSLITSSVMINVPRYCISPVGKPE